ncbi:hypothetical protein ABZ791_26400 [Streptomyces huasconensis]|uniref:Uncharacterized protein n=1 Tax=Streptomyces huasconensis TaxID=1854574 RepID=A0ABV3LWB6_9ACTN
MTRTKRLLVACATVVAAGAAAATPAFADGHTPTAPYGDRAPVTAQDSHVPTGPLGDGHTPTSPRG